VTSPGDAEGLPKRARIRRRREYLRVQRVAERRHTAHFVVLKAVATAGHTRFGITVSSRVGNAVARNRVKRVVREIVRRQWRRTRPAVDVVIIAKPAAVDVTYGEAIAELGQVFGSDG